MKTFPYHMRKVELLKLVVRVEAMKPADERDLTIEGIVEKAGKLDEFVVKTGSG